MWQSQCLLTQFVIALFFSAPPGLKGEVASTYKKFSIPSSSHFPNWVSGRKRVLFSILTIKFSIEWSILPLSSSLSILSLTHNNQGFVFTITLTFLFWIYLTLNIYSFLLFFLSFPLNIFVSFVFIALFPIWHLALVLFSSLCFSYFGS